MEVLDRIDELRKQRGWSVNNLAMEAMLTQSTLNNLYVRRAEPKLSTLRAICAAFGISLAEFFRYEELPETAIRGNFCGGWKCSARSKSTPCWSFCAHRRKQLEIKQKKGYNRGEQEDFL